MSLSLSPPRIPDAGGILRYSRWDSLLIGMAIVYAAVLVLAPSIVVVAVGVWWGSNSIAHCFLHKPFFRSPAMNGIFRCYLSAVLGVPQTLWRERHLAHHADAPWRFRLSSALVLDTAMVLLVWTLFLIYRPGFFLQAYLPGYAIGLLLCSLQGYYEHARGTISHYGWVYNLPFFNDGYHVEHHERPGAHWTTLPSLRSKSSSGSRWPAVLRWLDCFRLESLERLVLRHRWLQKLVIRSHQRAFEKMLPEIQHARRIGIVGGGLFPRTALVLQSLLPEADLVIIDQSEESLRIAEAWLPEGVEIIHGRYDPERHCDFDLIVIPLAYSGDRGTLYKKPMAPLTLIHDWIWKPWPESRIISLFLLKRLNLVKHACNQPALHIDSCENLRCH